MIEAGRSAPAFSLARHESPPFTERDLRGGTTVLVFYPFAFSPVCTDQLGIYNELLDDFADEGAAVYGVSCDSTWSQAAFRRQLGIDIEQLSDFWPHGRTSGAFGVLDPGGFAHRAIVIVGTDGVVTWSHLSASLDELPGPNLIFDALAGV